MQPSPQLESLTLDEAARLLRVEPWELERLALRRAVPARQIGTRWRFGRAALLDWLAGIDRGDEAPTAAALAPTTLSAMKGRGTAPAQTTEAPAPAKESEARTGEEPGPIGEAPEERTAEEVFLRRQGVLLAPGELTLEPALFFSRSDDRTLALVGTGVGLATVEQDTFTGLYIGRYGLMEETELSASTSYRHQRTGVFFGSREISDDSRTEFGDVALSLRRTVLRQGPGVPDIILSLDGRIPTGDTSYALGGGVAFIKSIDPVALFANANYRHTFSRDFADVTRLEPDDRIDMTLGYAFALNDTLSLSNAVSGLFTSATGFDAAELRQRDRFSLRFGLTSFLAEGSYIEPKVNFGLTPASPSA